MKVLSSSVADPFEIARKKFESKATVLSSSTESAPPAEMPGPSDMNPYFQKVGIDSFGIANNELGRLQLSARLKEKFGENFYQNPDALALITAFDESIKQSDGSGLKKMISAGERTLGAIFGGTGGLTG